MRVAIVTGGNRGIGFEIAAALYRSAQFSTVYLTARNAADGEAAIEKIRAESEKGSETELKYHQLDLTDNNSIQRLKTTLDEKHDGGFDVLVQNAAIAFKHEASEPFSVQAEVTLKTNFWGTLDLMKELFPKCRENGRIVLLSSFCSQSAQFRFKPNSFSNPIAKELYLVNDQLTVERMETLARKFVQDCKDGINEQNGWPPSAYGVSKLLTNCITRIFGKRAATENGGILVNCCCPGWAKTAMSSYSENAPKSPSQAAQIPLALAFLPAGIRGPQAAYISDA